MEGSKKKLKKQKTRLPLPPPDVSEQNENKALVISSPSLDKSKVKKKRKVALQGSSAEHGVVKSELVSKANERVAKKAKISDKRNSAEVDASANKNLVEPLGSGKKKKRDVQLSAPEADSDSTTQAKREQESREKKNVAEEKKAKNRELRERYKLDPSSLTTEEKVRAKALIRVFEATEAARAAHVAALVKGENVEGSNEKKRNRQAEIAAERKQKKLQNKQQTASEPHGAQESAHAGRGFAGRGRGVSEGRGRGMPGRGVSVSADAGQSGRGRGMGRRGAS